MNRHKNSSSELDKIGSKLIESSVLSESEIDRIAESPFLYSGVKARIAADVTQPAGAFGFRQVLLAFGSLLVVVGVGIVSLMVFRSEDPVALRRVVPARQQQVQPPVQDTLAEFRETASVPGPVMRERRATPQLQNASYGASEDRTPARRKPAQRTRPDIEFYPLAYAGDPKETVTGGRVLQVEMSRSSLFAMGFNIPIDNGAELVKADLLVGPDGVPRGIRLQ